MALPIIDVPICKWTLIVSDIIQGRIRIISENPSKYYYLIVPTGDPAPTNPIQGTLFIGSDLNLNFREPVDVYMIAFMYDGSVVFDPEANYIDTYVQDQTTPALITKFNQPQESTTLTAAAVQFGYELTVASVAGMVLPTVTENGSFLILFDVSTGRFMVCNVVSILGLVVTIDTQIDFEFPIGTIVDVCITNMAVDGSVTPQIFGIRGLGVVPGIDEEFDITRIIFTCLTETAVSLAEFGDIPKLLRGLMLRHRDGTVRNIFNVKSNLEIEGITLDWVPYASTNPAQGQNGFSARLTFGGQSKIGIVQRIGPGEDIEFIVQDDLTDLTLLEVIAEGHQVD